VAVVSAWALAHVNPKCEASAKAVPLLTKALGDPDPKFRREAAKGLCCYGPAAKSAAAALKKAADDEDPGVRAAATEALKAIGQ
jgi:HEAT repeat protein